MIKILCLIFLVPAIQCTAIEGFENIHTNHFDVTDRDAIKAVHLTPTELKLFSGHALTLVKNRCPAIDSRKLFKIQKYISKRLSLLNPTKADVFGETYMSAAIKSMQNCTKTPNTPIAAAAPVTAGAPEGVHAQAVPTGDGFLRIILWRPQQDQEKADSSSSSEEIEAVRVPAPTTTKHDTSFEFAHSAPAQIPPRDYDSMSAPLPTPPTEEDPKESEPEPIVVPIVQFHLNDWFSSMWESVTSFFHNAFNFGGSKAQAHPRARRAVVMGLGDTVKPAETEMVREDGKQAFASVFDEICAIYCECPAHTATNEFKVGVVQVLKFLFEDTKSLDTAAKHLIDAELIKELKACAP